MSDIAHLHDSGHEEHQRHLLLLATSCVTVLLTLASAGLVELSEARAVRDVERSMQAEDPAGVKPSPDTEVATEPTSPARGGVTAGVRGRTGPPGAE